MNTSRTRRLQAQTEHPTKEREMGKDDTKPVDEATKTVLVPLMIEVSSPHGDVSAQHPVYVPLQLSQPIGGGGNVDIEKIKKQIKKEIEDFLTGNTPGSGPAPTPQ